jgi:hypothetical protein
MSQEIIILVLTMGGLIGAFTLLYRSKWNQRTLAKRREGREGEGKVATEARELGNSLGNMAKGYGILILLAMLYAVGHAVLASTAHYVFPTSAWAYSMEYDTDNVYLADRPHTCEWGKAPLGNKYCHFDRVVETVKDDKGKVTSVYISWVKVEE